MSENVINLDSHRILRAAGREREELRAEVERNLENLLTVNLAALSVRKRARTIKLVMHFKAILAMFRPDVQRAIERRCAETGAAAVPPDECVSLAAKVAPDALAVRLR
jgi:hypothetical protein